MDLNSIVGMEIINARTATRLATVLDVVFDPKLSKVKNLLCFDDDDNEVIMSPRQILSVTDCILTMRSEIERYYPTASARRSVIGKRIIDTSGRYLGRVTNVTFEGQTTLSLISNDLRISPRAIRSTEGPIILIDPARLDSGDVDAHRIGNSANCADPVADDVDPGLETTADSTANTLDTTIDANISSFDFLRKMRTRTALFDHNGKLLIASGKNIDQQDIVLAIRHDKIMELCCIAEDVPTSRN